MTEVEIVTVFKDLVRFPHVCLNSKKAESEKKDIDFEMNGPLESNGGDVQFILKCRDCGYHHSIMIPLEDALSIRKFCVEKGAHTSDRFQKLDCYLCEKGEIQWQCYYFPKALANACKGYFEEEQKESKLIANLVFP